MSTDTEKFDAAVAHYCKGYTVAPGCRGEQCEHATVSWTCPDCASQSEQPRSEYPCCNNCDFEDDAWSRIIGHQGDREHQCEASFSSAQCDSCGSTFAGDRLPATMIPLDYKAGEDTMIEVSICTDCTMAWANGEDPEEWQQHPGDSI